MVDDSDLILVDNVVTPSTSTSALVYASEYEDALRGLDATQNLMTRLAPSTPLGASSSFAQLGYLVTSARAFPLDC